jgi:hypothetical protein
VLFAPLTPRSAWCRVSGTPTNQPNNTHKIPRRRQRRPATGARSSGPQRQTLSKPSQLSFQTHPDAATKRTRRHRRDWLVAESTTVSSTNQIQRQRQSHRLVLIGCPHQHLYIIPSIESEADSPNCMTMGPKATTRIRRRIGQAGATLWARGGD